MLVGLLLDLSHLGVSEEEPPLSVGAAARHQGEVDLLIILKIVRRALHLNWKVPEQKLQFLLPPPSDELSL